MDDQPFCAECKESFPVIAGAPFRMGQLRPLSESSQRWQDRYRSWLDHDAGAYLCGNCYFDLTDADG